MTRNKILQEGSATTWDDVVFIPPGFDVSTTPAKQQAAADVGDGSLVGELSYSYTAMHSDFKICGFD